MKSKYNTEMLRDFIDHLRWEVRIVHAEHHHLKAKVNPELVDALEPYMKKYGCGLLSANAFTPGNSPDSERAGHLLEQFLRERAVRWYRCIEALDDLFQEAIQCAGLKGPAMRNWTTGEIIKLLNKPDGQTVQGNECRQSGATPAQQALFAEHVMSKADVAGYHRDNPTGGLSFNADDFARQLGYLSDEEMATLWKLPVSFVRSFRATGAVENKDG